jgi:hypothetical protein
VRVEDVVDIVHFCAPTSRWTYLFPWAVGLGYMLYVYAEVWTVVLYELFEGSGLSCCVFRSVREGQEREKGREENARVCVEERFTTASLHHFEGQLLRSRMPLSHPLGTINES